MKAYERFLKYVKINTVSDEASGAHPSSARQFDLAKILVDELCAMGIEAHCDEKCYVYATVPASEGCENEPSIGFIAHMDTAPDFCGEGVDPKVIENYDGGDVELGEGRALLVSEFPHLASLKGRTLITTDGKTLLGADDKAGIAEIMSALAYLSTHPEVGHRELWIAFTPDEEIGQGTDHFDLSAFRAPFAYTVDGGALGELEYENFNAACATVTVKGINIHPGSAKGKMKNAVLMANAFLSMLPAAEAPAHTEGYEGFYHVTDMAGNESEATVSLLVRDHDRAKFEERKAFLTRLVAYLNGEWGEGSFTLTLRDSYYNMREIVEKYPEVISLARAAMEAEGVTPKVVPIRGGTDGARLSFMGIPCPNLSTGGENFHSVHEYVSVRSMEKMRDVLIRLVRA